MAGAMRVPSPARLRLQKPERLGHCCPGWACGSVLGTALSSGRFGSHGLKRRVHIHSEHMPGRDVAPSTAQDCAARMNADVCRELGTQRDLTSS